MKRLQLIEGLNQVNWLLDTILLGEEEEAEASGVGGRIESAIEVATCVAQLKSKSLLLSRCLSKERKYLSVFT